MALELLGNLYALSIGFNFMFLGLAYVQGTEWKHIRAAIPGCVLLAPLIMFRVLAELVR